MAKPTTKYSVEDSIKLIEILKNIRDAHALLSGLSHKYSNDSCLASDELDQQMADLVAEIQQLTIEKQREREHEAMCNYFKKLIDE
jgi:uncharacterized small protein (DUF1192 family)